MRIPLKAYIRACLAVIIALLFFVFTRAESYLRKEKEIAASTFADFSSAMTSPTTAGKTVVVSAPVSIKDITIPQDRTLRIAKGGRITIMAGGSLNIRGSFTADKYQVFSGPGNVIFSKDSTKEIYPQWWGAVADGTTDCYNALKSMAAAVSASGGGNVVFPKGTYFIAKYKLKEGSGLNDVSDIVFENCSRLIISGYGAKIDVVGKFHRSAAFSRITKRLSIIKYSNVKCVTPFLMRNCVNMAIEGFEIDGNADMMTRDDKVVESGGHGIIIKGGTDFTLKDIYVHHFHGDGIYMTGYSAKNVTYPCRKGSLINIKSSNNARQGLSIIHARDIICTDCIFSETGKTGGAYGGHDPQAGVDIEPTFSAGNISFIRCIFENNIGAQFNAAHGQSTENVLLKDCRIAAKTGNFRYAVIFAVNGGVIEDSEIDTGNGSFYAGWGNKFEAMQKVVIRGCKIRTRMKGVVSQNAAEVLIENNSIVNYYDSQDESRSVTFINNPNCFFRGNYVFMPKEVSSGKKNSHIASTLKIKESSNNTFDSDLVAVSDEHFTTDYGKSTVVINDQYIPKGSSLSYRPFRDALWDNAQPYSKNVVR